jgi:hypothetical protein
MDDEPCSIDLSVLRMKSLQFILSPGNFKFPLHYPYQFFKTFIRNLFCSNLSLLSIHFTMAQSTSDYTAFWNWFSSVSTHYFEIDKSADVQKDLYALKARLAELNESLTFEIGPVRDNGRRELVISADGIKAAFPQVIDLVHAAPEFEQWTIFAFRQPQKEIAELHYGPLRVSYTDIYFRAMPDGDKLAAELHIRNYEESEWWNGAMFILLDNVVGEYQTEMRLGHLSRVKLQEAEIGNLQPLAALADVAGPAPVL